MITDLDKLTAEHTTEETFAALVRSALKSGRCPGLFCFQFGHAHSAAHSAELQKLKVAFDHAMEAARSSIRLRIS